MDPVSFMAATAVAVLLEVFKGTATAAGTEIFNLIKRWLQGNPQADALLEQAKTEPEAFLPAIEFHIKELASSNQEFYKELQGLLSKIEPMDKSAISVSQSKNVGIATGQSSVSLNVTESLHKGQAESTEA